MLNKVVTHPRYGRGVVKQTRHGGTNLYVHFDGQSGLFCVRIDEVEFESLPTYNLRHLQDPQQAARLKPRRMIEAFRHGIVPEDCMEAFTFGREEETQRLSQWLNDPEESGLLVIGEYGAGKTHLLNYIRSFALTEGFAVATAQVNPLESPFSRPKRVYGQLVQSLRIKTPEGELGDFRSLLKQAFRNNLLDAHRYFKHVKAHQNYESVWQWIEAKEDHPRPYSDNNQFRELPGLYGNNGKPANIYCHLLSSIGWVAQHQSVDSKGLLLIFDEAEALHASQTPTSFERSYNFLEALLATARGDQHLLQYPSQSGFDYSAHAESTPFLYKLPSGLKILLAFTDDKDFFCQGLKRLSRLSLQPLQPDALDRIFDRICSLYSDVYGISTQELRVDEIRDLVTDEYGSTRQIVKGYVEALDLMRFYPDADPYEVLQ
jgi:hypothetical protein